MRDYGMTALTFGLAMLAAGAANAGNLVVNGDFSAGNSRAVSERIKSVGGFPNQLVSD